MMSFNKEHIPPNIWRAPNKSYLYLAVQARNSFDVTDSDEVYKAHDILMIWFLFLHGLSSIKNTAQINTKYHSIHFLFV
jgi:hypothetical protein